MHVFAVRFRLPVGPSTNTGLTLFWQSGLGKKFAHEFEFIYQEYKNSLLQREGLGLVLLGDELSAALDAPRSDTPHLRCLRDPSLGGPAPL